MPWAYSTISLMFGCRVGSPPVNSTDFSPNVLNTFKMFLISGNENSFPSLFLLLQNSQFRLHLSVMAKCIEIGLKIPLLISSTLSALKTIFVVLLV